MEKKGLKRVMMILGIMASLTAFNACTEDGLITDEENGLKAVVGKDSKGEVTQKEAEAIVFDYTIAENRDGRMHYWEYGSDGLTTSDTLYNVNTGEITKILSYGDLTVTKYNEVTVTLTSSDERFPAALKYLTALVEGDGIAIEKTGDASYRLVYKADGTSKVTIGLGDNTESVEIASKGVISLEGVLVKVDDEEILIKAEASDNAEYVEFRKSDWDYKWPGYYGLTISPDIAGIGSDNMVGMIPNSEVMRNGKTIEIVSVVPQNASFTRCEFALVNNSIPYGAEGYYPSDYMNYDTGSCVEYTNGYMGNADYCPDWNWALPGTYQFKDGELGYTEVNSNDMKAQYGVDEVNIEDFLSWKTWNYKSIQERKEEGDTTYPIVEFTHIYFIVKAEKGYNHLSWYAYDYNTGDQESYVSWHTWRRGE